MVSGYLEGDKAHFELSLKQDISPKIIFIDAITRSGKAILSDLIPSLDRMEHIQFCTELELTIQGLTLGAISRDYANSFLRIYFNELSYNLQISRNVNFRATDQTGIQNFREPSIYYDRLKRDEGDSILDSCKYSSNYLPISTHELLVSWEDLNKLDINFAILSLWRDPVDVVYSWIKRGWGIRYANDDPRSFTLSVKNGSQVYPWYLALDRGDILGAQGSELCAKCVMALIDKGVENIKKVPSNKIHLVTFEGLCRDPDNVMDGVCNWLGVQKTSFTATSFERARVPRLINPQERLMKLDFLRGEISHQSYGRLHEYSERYRLGLYGIQENFLNK